MSGRLEGRLARVVGAGPPPGGTLGNGWADPTLFRVRFAEDGARKGTRSTEVFGLDESNRYQFQDLYVSKLTGRTEEGMLIADLAPVGRKPTFAGEVAEYALQDQVRLTEALWEL